MKIKVMIAALAVGLSASYTLQAAVSEEEAARLGADLTPTGAEQAGNADGSIPPWTGGGVEDIPAGFDPGSGIYINPFADDEILYSITKANMGDYADVLSEGQQALLEKFGDEGYKLNVYPTRRTFAAPQWYYDGSRANATGATLEDNGQRIADNVPGVPFPMPQSGLEALWNHMIRWMGYEWSYLAESFYVDSNGKPILASNARNLWEFPMFMPYSKPDRDYKAKDVRWGYIRSDFEAPARRAGEILLVHEPGANYSAGKGRSAWKYLLGQRRVRKAPAVSFDSPRPASAGTSTYDDAYMYNGSPERFDWKLVGKKELIVPYNNYEALFEHDNIDILGKNFVKPEVMRYEKHRVWIVEGTLKEGIRHVYSKRQLLIDEDSWHVVQNGRWDGEGKLWRVGIAMQAMIWDVPAPLGMGETSYDLNRGLYNVTGNPIPGTLRQSTDQPVNYFSPQGMARSGIR